MRTRPSTTQELAEAGIGIAVAVVLLLLFTGLPTVLSIAIGVVAGMGLARGLQAWRHPRRGG